MHDYRSMKSAVLDLLKQSCQGIFLFSPSAKSVKSIACTQSMHNKCTGNYFPCTGDSFKHLSETHTLTLADVSTQTQRATDSTTCAFPPQRFSSFHLSQALFTVMDGPASRWLPVGKKKKRICVCVNEMW